MSVSAKETRKALRRNVASLLKVNSFNDSTGTKYWRHENDKTDHIEITCLSTYRALTERATTASFDVRIGISLPHYGFHNDPFQKDYIPAGPNGPRPRESRMPIRGVLCPKAAPSLSKGRWGWEFQELWRIGSEQQAEDAAQELCEQLESYALDWMERDWDLHQFQELLRSEETNPLIATAGNGSHLRLACELYGSQIRQAHLAMVKSALKAAGE